LRLGRRSPLLALVGSTCALAAHASAAPAPTFFKLSISGRAHAEWTYSAAPTVEGGCRRTVTSEGIRSATFRTTKAVTVRIASGKLLPVTVRAIRGTVTLGGANTTDERCGEANTSKIADCARTRRSFAGADFRAMSPRRGILAVTPIRNIRLTPSDCPIEPVGVRRRPLGPAPHLLRLPKVISMERKLARITLHTSRTQRTTFGSPESGRLEEDVAWTLTLVRIPG
jgi:hypothetical protein